MFGNEKKPKILKNKNGNTSVRLKSNIDTSLIQHNENNLNNGNNKNG